MAPSTQTKITGRKPVLEALDKSVTTFEKVFIQRGIRGEFEKELRSRCKIAGIPLVTVPGSKLAALSRTNHQGVVAVVSPVSFYELSTLVAHAFERGKNPLFILLDRITDTRNFGAIARTCEVMGADGMVIPRKGSASINDEAIKSSGGALLSIPVCRESSLVGAVSKLKGMGLHIVCASLKAKTSIENLDCRRPLAVVLGSEGEGISPSLEKLADQTFVIPQLGRTESLNVSVAAGIILYEINRQRGFRDNSQL